MRLFIGADLLIEVQDDGIGVPLDVTRRSGLANLEERARRRGGSMSVGRSTTAARSWPGRSRCTTS